MNHEKSSIRVAVAADARYAPGLYCTVSSMLLHLDPARAVTIHVLDGGIDSRDWQCLCRRGLQFHPRVAFDRIPLSPESFAGFHRHRTGSLLPYARLRLPSLLDAERVLYLDSDLFVGRDIGELWETDLNECLVAAARDPLVRVLANDWPWPADPQVDLQAPYFNTGVLLMDLRGWRRERIEDRALEELRAAPQQFRFWDQTVLNPLLRGRVHWLPDFWNRFFWQADRAGFDDLRCILHFAAWTPWIEYAYSDGHRLYHRFMRISGFDREWRARGWRRSRIKRRLLLALAPWLPAYYRARARVCVRQGHADQARLFEQAASDWVREGRRYREARCNRRWNRTQIDRYLRDLRSLIRAREGEA